MAEVFYSRSWAAPPLAVDVAAAKRLAVFAVVGSVVLHLLTAVVFPYLSATEPVPPELTLTVELAPPPEENPTPVRASAPRPRVQSVMRPPPVSPPIFEEPPRVPEPQAPQQAEEPHPVLQPVPAAPVPVAQPDIAVERPATNSAVPEIAVDSAAPVAPAEDVPAQKAPVESASTLPTPVPLTSLTAQPKLRGSVTPIYPRRMQRLGKEATMLIEVLVDERGKVRKVTVVKSAGPAFDEAVIAAYHAAQYEPGMMGTRAVAVLLRIPLSFTLR